MLNSHIPKLSGVCYALRSMFISVTLSNQFTMHILFCYKIWNNYWGKSSNSGKISILPLKIVRIVAGAQPRTSCRSLWTIEGFYLLPTNIYFHEWT